MEHPLTQAAAGAGISFRIVLIPVLMEHPLTGFEALGFLDMWS